MKRNLLKFVFACSTVALGISTLSLLETKERLTNEVQFTNEKHASVVEDLYALQEMYNNDTTALRESLINVENEYNTLANSVVSTDGLVTIGTFKVTAYSPFDSVSGIDHDGDPSVTSIGMTPGPYVVAVDPTVIPYGTNILVVYEDGDYLIGVAGDTGGAIKGNRLDIFKHTWAEAMAFGTKTAKVVTW